MRLLANLEDESEVVRVRELLRLKGIPTTTSLGGSGGAPVRLHNLSVFVCLNEHFEDAQILLSNEEHEVANPVDVEHYELLASQQDHTQLLRSAVLVAAVVIVAFATAVYLFAYRVA